MRSKTLARLGGGDGVEEVHKTGITQVYGDFTQFDFTGPYSGNQCTSMSVAAAVVYLLHPGEDFHPETINQTLIIGHSLHGVFRDTLQLSHNPDMRVGIDDIAGPPKPITGLFTQDINIRLKRLPCMGFTTKVDFGDLPSLTEYLVEHRSADCAVPQAFLLTVEEYSYAIIKPGDGTFRLFDSHGTFTRRFRGHTPKRKAGIFTFTGVNELASFITVQRGKQQLLAISELEVSVQKECLNKKDTRQHTECPIIQEISQDTEQTPWWISYMPSYREFFGISGPSAFPPAMYTDTTSGHTAPAIVKDPHYDVTSSYVAFMGQRQH